MSNQKTEKRIAIYLADEVIKTSKDKLEIVASTTPLPEQAHSILEIIETSGYSYNAREKVYFDAWRKLYKEVLDEKTSWRKEELKKRMDKLLIECMEVYL